MQRIYKMIKYTKYFQYKISAKPDKQQIPHSPRNMYANSKKLEARKNIMEIKRNTCKMFT